jgi:hypothetical protein
VIAAAWLLAAIGDPVATLAFEPVAAEVGQPVVATLAVEHDADTRPELPDLAEGLDDSWVVLSSLGVVADPVPDGAQRATTTARWEIAALEPGARELPSLEVSAGAALATAAPAVLQVTGLLGEGEDEPRPLPAFRPAPDWGAPETGRSWWVHAAGAAVLAALLAAAFAVRRARRAAPPPWGPSPFERAVALAAGPPTDPAELRAAHFEVAALVRGAVDGRLGRDGAARSDEEWLAGLDSELARAGADPALASDAAALLERCTAVRWAGRAPSSFGARETFEGARDLIERVLPGEEASA